jgi:SNF2 family DNA or RNA helicase
MRDIRRLSKINFSLAAFDEAQFIKNTATKTYAAALDLKAAMKVAVTGTPIENRLGDLKALMDLAVPGYLGSDNFFAYRYESEGANRLGELRQLVKPFALRRTKQVVLTELPEKIEDFRYCRLTETQVRLYRDAVAARRTGLLHALKHEDEAIPYIHIFALLTILKQICNHPASVTDKAFDSGKGTLDSGKWQLFEELVDACLENGQKIVVFSQFVKMIEIITRHLKNKGIGFAGITGQTRNRGREIDRFNEDEDCRVFVGSLKAGGSGIDLIAGSVVIHYDRWWNAAKEDQATDRVHRIGQTRGVQVFKLVTEGTLEEKISAIIDRKRKLMAEVISEDDPGMLKAFTREELIDLLSLPDQN